MSDKVKRKMNTFVTDTEKMERDLDFKALGAKVLEEISKWCENPSYEPKEIELRERLSTNDLCHFIWNIGERLGRSYGYDGESRAKFVKNFFALDLSDVEVTSLKKMAKTSSSDRIHLDRPDPNDNSFHFPPVKKKKKKFQG